MDPNHDRVLRTFLDADGRLTRMPSKAAKRRIILEHVAAAFAPGVRMTELEVNTVLRGFYEDDYVALRRYLIDTCLLSREDGGEYWRPGDTADVA